MPSVATMPATMVANAAVGPEICTREPPRNAIRKPATIAVYKPCSGPTPDAIASAIESGNATMATTMPDTMSRGSCSLSSSLLECLMMLNRIGLILSRCKGSQFLFVVRRSCRARRLGAKAALPRKPDRAKRAEQRASWPSGDVASRPLCPSRCPDEGPPRTGSAQAKAPNKVRPGKGFPS